MLKKFIPYCALLLCSCSSPSEQQSYSWHEILGRDEEAIAREAIYRIRVPAGWQILEQTYPSVIDTTLPLSEYAYQSDNGWLKATVYNFPTDEIEMRIPIENQAIRWRKQLGGSQTEEKLAPQSFNGFHGVLYANIGILSGEETAMLAWALHIGKDHYYAIMDEASSKSTAKKRQMRADVAIKVIGSPELLQQQYSEIEAFARSFELIDEIPARL